MFFLLKNKNKLFFSFFFLLIAMVSIQSGASLAKSLFPKIGALGVTVLRLFLATIVMLIVFKPWRKKINFCSIKNLLVYGLSLGLMNLFFYMSLQKIPLGIAVALEFTGPLMIALFSSRRVLDIVWVFIVIVGLSFLLPVNSEINKVDIIGVIYALFSGFFWGMYIIFGQRAGNNYGSSTVALGLSISTLIFFPIGILNIGIVPLFDISILPIAFAVAILSTAFPYTIEMFALMQMPKKIFSILMSLEPVIGALIGTVFLHEHLILTQWFALLCIIIASICSISTVKEKTKKTSKNESFQK